MRKSRAFRVSSTRDICIFCATRQLAAADGLASSPSSSQRRQLNSSSKAPQNASEGMVYKEEDAPAAQPKRMLTQAEKMQQLLRARAPAPPPPPPPTAPPIRSHMSHMQPRDNGRASFQGRPPSQGPYQQQRQPMYPPPQNRMQGQPRQPMYPPPQNQMQRQPMYPAQGRPQRQPMYAQNQMQRPPTYPPQNQMRSPPMYPPQNQAQRPPMQNNFAPGASQMDRRRVPTYAPAPSSQQAGGQDFNNSRYNVNMKPRNGPAVETPAFGAGQLRRRNDAQAFGRPPPMRQPPRMSQSELDNLLGNNSKLGPGEQPRPRAPLLRETNVQRTCMHCGSQLHGSLDCPKKPVLRQPKAPDVSQPDVSKQKGNIFAAAESFARQHGSRFENEQSSYEATEERRRKDSENDRRSRRFQVEDIEPVETRNRYEEPERRRGGGRQRGRVMREEDFEAEDRYVDKAERKRLRQEAKKKTQEAKGPVPVYLPEYISVSNLATLLKVRVDEFIAKLEELGFEEVQSDHILNAEHAGLVAQEYNFEPIVQAEEDDGDLHPAPALSPEEYAKLPARPPVVTIMGHVDHGKTTILDYLRSTSVAAGEFGGITQHIGAFSVPLSSGKKITFLDTPGHSAFETMRARGANVTDIVVLVVAADDSVMPQTVEAIKHAQAANVPMIIAINKIDLPSADPDAVKLDLGRHGIEVEDFGGDVQVVCISGVTGQGIPDLEEAITTLSEMLDHRADPKANVEGWILEGTTKASGKVATILVRSGTLRVRDFLVAGNTWARVRSLRNESGTAVQEVGPGMPAEVDGWREQPIAGDEVLQATDEQQAQEVSALRTEKLEREQMAIDMEAINESRRQDAERRDAEEAAAAAENGELPESAAPKAETGPELISFVIKGDVSGSVEAVIDSVSALGNGEVGTRILRHGVGAPAEFDVEHAADAKGHIINFNTPVPNNIKALAEKKGVQILDSNIIYRVVENVKTMLEEKLPPKITHKVSGEAEVAVTFEIGLGGKRKMVVAGSKVRNGDIKKNSRARVVRKEEVVHEGVIGSLKSHKKDVLSMHKDTECGIAFADGWSEFQAGDKIQCYDEERTKRTL